MKAAICFHIILLVYLLKIRKLMLIYVYVTFFLLYNALIFELVWQVCRVNTWVKSQ